MQPFEFQLIQHGESLRPLLEGEPVTRDFARAEWELLPTRAGVALSLQVIRTETHKLTLDLISGAGELYDLVNDPDEMNNRFDHKECADVQAELVKMIETRPEDKRDLQVQVGLA